MGVVLPPDVIAGNIDQLYIVTYCSLGTMQDKNGDVFFILEYSYWNLIVKVLSNDFFPVSLCVIAIDCNKVTILRMSMIFLLEVLNYLSFSQHVSVIVTQVPLKRAF